MKSLRMNSFVKRSLSCKQSTILFFRPKNETDKRQLTEQNLIPLVKLRLKVWDPANNEPCSDSKLISSYAQIDNYNLLTKSFSA